MSFSIGVKQKTVNCQGFADFKQLLKDNDDAEHFRSPEFGSYSRIPKKHKYNRFALSTFEDALHSWLFGNVFAWSSVHARGRFEVSAHLHSFDQDQERVDNSERFPLKLHQNISKIITFRLNIDGRTSGKIGRQACFFFLGIRWVLPRSSV